VRVKRSLSVGYLVPIAWSIALAALIAGCGELHAVFGMLLCAFVAGRFMHYLHDSAHSFGSDLRMFTRHLSRLIYLMLYGLLLLKFFTELTRFSWHDGPALGWSPHFQAAPERVFIECGERFRLDLIWGVIALCLIRVLSAYQIRAEVSRASAAPTRSVLLSGPAAQKE
jgi:hypothetical protein